MGMWVPLKLFYGCCNQILYNFCGMEYSFVSLKTLNDIKTILYVSEVHKHITGWIWPKGHSLLIFGLWHQYFLATRLCEVIYLSQDLESLSVQLGVAGHSVHKIQRSVVVFEKQLKIKYSCSEYGKIYLLLYIMHWMLLHK